MSEHHRVGEGGRVALVTGGSGGIGRAVAERLAGDRVAVAMHYSGNRARAEETVLAITSAGGRAKAVVGDVANEREMAEALDDVERSFGGIDVVVHTAGIMVLSPVVDYDLDEFDRVIRTNLRGTFVVDQLAARRVREGGAIVNVSTSVTRLRQPTYGVYAATKGAAETMTPILARELCGHDVAVNAVNAVNAVAPGPTATPFFFEGQSQESIDAITNANPMRCPGEPEDIAEVVSFLVGPGRWVDGQTIYANGGAIYRGEK